MPRHPEPPNDPPDAATTDRDAENAVRDAAAFIGVKPEVLARWLARERRLARILRALTTAFILLPPGGAKEQERLSIACEYVAFIGEHGAGHGQ